MNRWQSSGDSRAGDLALRRNADLAAALQRFNARDRESVRLVEYWDVLRRRRAVILLSCLGCGLLGGLLAFSMKPVYRARASIEVMHPDTARPAQEASTNTASDAPTFLQNQAAYLKSETLIRRVVEKLQLQTRPEHDSEPGVVASVVAWLTPGDTAHSTSLQRAVRSASARLTVAPSPESDFIELYFDSPDQEMAAKFANTLAEEYIEQSLAVSWEASERKTAWLTGQLDKVKAKLAESERDLQELSGGNPKRFAGEEGITSEDELHQIRTELAGAKATRIERQLRYEMASCGAAEALPEVINDGMLRQYQADLTALRQQLNALPAAASSEQEEIERTHSRKLIEAGIAELETALSKEYGRLVQGLKNEFEAAERREEILTERYEHLQMVAASDSAKAARYGAMQREVEADRGLFESMLQRVKEAGGDEAVAVPTSRVVDSAQLPLEPSGSNFLLNSSVGLFAGLFLGIVVAFGRERADRPLNLPGELSFHLRVPELGVIPRFDGVRARPKGPFLAPPLNSKEKLLRIFGGQRVRDDGSNGAGSDVAAQRQPDAGVESFRTVLSSILLCRKGDSCTVIAVSSPRPGEGKTTVVSNLAVALAEVNRRVLVIDGDLRTPRLDTVLREPNGWGLSDLLCEGEALAERRLHDLVQKTRIPNVYALFSGGRTVSAANLLHSPRLPELIRRFRQEFDTVLIDAPPVLAQPDARVLGKLADGVVLVLRANHSTLGAARAARKSLTDDGATVLGTILNAWEPAFDESEPGGATDGDDCESTAYAQEAESRPVRFPVAREAERS